MIQQEILNHPIPFRSMKAISIFQLIKNKHAHAHAHAHAYANPGNLIRRNFAFNPTPPVSKSQVINAMGLVGAFGAITGVLAMAPLDEFERIEKKNVAYHHHLHPR